MAWRYNSWTMEAGRWNAIFHVFSVQMRWMRRNKFSVGRNFFAWAVENGTVYIAGGRVDSRTLQCSNDMRCMSAERIVRGCDSPCDAVNDRAKPTPWRLVGQLPAAMCVFAHCVVTLPVTSEQATTAAATAAETPVASSAVSIAVTTESQQSRSSKR